MNNWYKKIVFRIISMVAMMNMFAGKYILNSSVQMLSIGVRASRDTQITTDVKAIHEEIYRYVNVATSVVAIVGMIIAVWRWDESEIWDRLILVGMASSAFIILVLLTARRLHNMPSQSIFEWDMLRGTLFSGTWILVIIAVVFWWYTFQKENLPFTYLGFPWYVFILSLLGTRWVNHLLLNRMPYRVYRIVQVITLVVLVGGVYTTFVPVDVMHNTYVINEILAPIGTLHYFDTFIPQYTVIYGLFVDMLMYFGITNNPDVTIDLIYIMLQLLVGVTLYLAVRITYTNMVVPRWSTAILFAIPPILFAQWPWWDWSGNGGKSFYYSMNMYNYSLVPNRYLVVFVVGTVGIWVISRIQQKKTLLAQLVVVYSVAVLAILGLYHSGDFGTFAAIGVGVSIVCYPFISIRRRIILTSVYCTGMILNYLLLLQGRVWLGLTVNADYLFWFQRQFASGFGATPIQFPGNGLFVIGTAVVTAATGVWISVLMRDRMAMYQHDTQLTHMYTSVVYFGVTTVLGLSYYLNRSNMSFHGSSAFITLFVGVFALYNLILHIQSEEERNVGVNTDNFVMRFLVAVPLSIALTHAYIPRELPRYESGSTLTLAEYGLVMTTIKEYHDEIEAAGFTVAYGGTFGHVVELYEGIPAVSLFNSVEDTTMSPAAADAYCGTLLLYDEYDVILVSGMYYSPIFPGDQCDGLVVLYRKEKYTTMNLLVREDFAVQYPVRFRKLINMMTQSVNNCCSK